MTEPTLRTTDAREPRPLRAAPEMFPVPESEAPTLGEYIGILLGARWLILGVTVVAAALSLAYVLAAAPLYRADILVQVEEKAQGLGFDELSDMFSGKAPAETEIEIIRSRSLLSSVVDELGLEVIAAPRRLPLLGGTVARRYEGEGPRAPLLGLDRFGWGGERIAVSRLDVPKQLLGKRLTLVASDGGGYTVLGTEEDVLVQGRVGELAEGNGVAVFVTDLVARPGTEFRLVRQRRAKVIGDLQRELAIAERGKKTGILQVSLEGLEPQRISAIVDAVSRSYLRQNVERKSAEAQKTLDFLETQLPQLRENLETAEAALETYRKTNGSVNVSLETDAMLKRAVDVEKALSELEGQRAELAGRFTDTHPLMATVRSKLSALQAERAELEGRMKRLPKAEMDSARLMRDAKVANELYVLLLNKSQELRVVKSGTIGNVRILDAAMLPEEPVWPKKPQTLAISLLLGFALGVALALVRHALSRGVEDPEAIERDTGLPVYASIPRSEGERRLDRSSDVNKVLAVVDPNDVSVESFRSLRTSLQFALIDAPNRVICVLGPAPTIGKSFCSANLGAVLAESGKRVVVVDADLRKGRLHRYFGGGREHGLSELITGGLSADAVLRKTAVENLCFVASGRVPPNPAGFLGSERFSSVLADLSARFDFVVIDTAPVLAVTDAVLVARHAGVNLMVLRAGKHPTREITAALRRFDQGGVKVHGAVLNDVQAQMGYAKYGGYHYQYEYGAKRK